MKKQCNWMNIKLEEYKTHSLNSADVRLFSNNFTPTESVSTRSDVVRFTCYTIPNSDMKIDIVLPMVECQVASMMKEFIKHFCVGNSFDDSCSTWELEDRR